MHVFKVLLALMQVCSNMQGKEPWTHLYLLQPAKARSEKPLANTRDGKHKLLVDLDHDLTKSVSKASSSATVTLSSLGTVTKVGRSDGAKIHEERSPNSSRVKFLEHRFGGTSPQSIHPPATCALVHTECHGSPSVAKHGSISNSETSSDRGSAGLLRTPRNKSTFDIAATLLEGNITRSCRHRADSYKY